MKNKKLVIILGVILLLVVVGVSYAWLTTTILGKKEYVLKAGELDLVLDETSNGLTIDNAIPVEDVIGLASEGATFSVRNNGKANICYQLYLDDMELSENEIRVDDQFIKYSLDKDGVVGEAKILTSSGSNPNRLIDEAEIRAGSTVQYKLRLWFNASIDGEIAGQVFKGRLRIEAMQCDSNLPVMKVLEEKEAFYADEYKQKITSILTKDNIIIPDTAVASWDVSEENNGSVVAYLEDDGAGGYVVTIGGAGGILANQNSTWLFSNFTAATRIDLSYFNTSNVTNMYSMFYGCSSLVDLNISHFDTSNVGDMRSMFANCSSLLYLNLVHFDTSQVKLMSNMFERCSQLLSINLSSFNTSQVTNIGSMFYGCISLISLDLTSFDTLHMSEMGHVFAACRNLSQVIVSDKWITTNASTTNMFLNCGCDQVSVV